MGNFHNNPLGISPECSKESIEMVKLLLSHPRIEVNDADVSNIFIWLNLNI